VNRTADDTESLADFDRRFASVRALRPKTGGRATSNARDRDAAASAALDFFAAVT